MAGIKAGQTESTVHRQLAGLIGQYRAEAGQIFQTLVGEKVVRVQVFAEKIVLVAFEKQRSRVRVDALSQAMLGIPGVSAF